MFTHTKDQHRHLAKWQFPKSLQDLPTIMTGHFDVHQDDGRRDGQRRSKRRKQFRSIAEMLQDQRRIKIL